MNGIGSYHATVYGVGKYFSNQVYSDYIQTNNRIIMKGYNYDQLYAYCEALRERLIASGKGRIKEVFLLGENYSDFFIGRGSRKVYRNRLGMDKYFLAENGSDVAFAYNEAKRYSRAAAPVQSEYIGGVNAPVNIMSLQSEEYDFWNLNNAPLKTSSGQFVKLKDFSSVIQGSVRQCDQP